MPTYVGEVDYGCRGVGERALNWSRSEISQWAIPYWGATPCPSTLLRLILVLHNLSPTTTGSTESNRDNGAPLDIAS